MGQECKNKTSVKVHRKSLPLADELNVVGCGNASSVFAKCWT